MFGLELLHYRVTRPLGSGGMGEVYLAEDMRLKRQVAIKILPPALAHESERRDRFAREAQAVAALNHPNIVTIDSVESGQGDTYFITMEYVDGRTLADLLPRHGFPLRRLLTIAIQIADAMAVAHQHRIVHRDLKPANVMLTGQDRVKVLDFGLAKLRESPNDAAGGALPTRELTGEGTIVGTVAYMSPEQAEGKSVDERSDIFSLGVMLYEMATGDRPFKGDTNVSVLSSVLRDTPKTLTELNPELPRDFARIVRRCLVKDPEHRYQSAKDVRNELEEVRQSLDSGELVVSALAPRRFARWSAVVAGLGALGVIVLAVAVWLKTSSGTSTPPLMKGHARLTRAQGLKRFPNISPDSKWVVYSAGGDLYLQSVSGQTPINLTPDSPSTETMPAFAPDGETIAFRSDRDGGGIFMMGRTGEAIRRVTTQGFLPAWLPDGRRLVFSTEGPRRPTSRERFSELWIVDTQGGQPQRLFHGDAVQPRVSPHGKRIAFWAVPSDATAKRIGGVGANRDIWTIDLNGENPIRATTHDAYDWNPVWSPDGRWLFFLSDRGGSMNLWRVAIDEMSGVTTGEPQPLTVPAPYVADFSLSANGAVGTYTSILMESNIGRVDFDCASATAKGAITAVTSGANQFTNIDATRDGRSIVANNYEHEDLYVVTADSGAMRQLTNDTAKDRFPRWFPDGRNVVFYSDRSGPFELWRIGVDGGGLQRLATPQGAYMYPAPSRAGKLVLASDRNRRQVFIFDQGDLSKPLETLPPFPDSAATPIAEDWSPDDGKITIAADSGGRVILWVYSRDTHTYRQFVDGGDSAWLSDGRRVLYDNRDRLWMLDTLSGDTKEVLAIPGERLSYPLPVAGDSKLLFLRSSENSDIWTVRFDPK